MDEIAAAAEVTKLTIYRRFPAKEDLLLSVVDHEIEDLKKAVQIAEGTTGSALNRLHAVALTLFESVVSQVSVSICQMYFMKAEGSARLSERSLHWRSVLRDALVPAIRNVLEAQGDRDGETLELADVLFELIAAQGWQLALGFISRDEDTLRKSFDARWSFFARQFN